VDLQDAPAAFDEVVLAMVRRIVHQLDFQSGGVRELHQPVHELGPNTRILRAVVQGHRIKIGELGRMADPAFGENLSFCGTSSHLFTMFAVALVIINKYNIYVQ